MSGKKAKLNDKLSSRLPAPLGCAFQTLVRLAEEDHLAVYLVGGPVRDLLLGRVSLDLDFAVEGDAGTLAARLASELGLRLVRHPAFLTATVRADGFFIDLAAARSETYSRPGALPEVVPAGIEEDLRRRDFTVNAMALAVTGDRAGDLIDPAGGQRDLVDRVVRVLHDRSFQDDATRILRAARYEVRFGFCMTPHTLDLLHRDVTCLDTISGARIHQEINRTLAEPEPENAFLRLQALGVLRAIHPGLAFDERSAAAFADLRRLAPQAPPAAPARIGSVSGGYWPLLAWQAAAGQIPGIVRRLELNRQQAAAVRAVPQLRALHDRLGRPSLRPSQVVQALKTFPPPAVWALAAAAEGLMRDRCLGYLRRWRYARTSLRGDDLIALGVSPGPALGDVLERLKVAKLDGEVRSRRDEERLAREILSGAAVRVRRK